MKLDCKWKQFIISWFVVFWTAPSYKIHNFLMVQTPPPGSDLSSPAIFQPFGAVYILNEISSEIIDQSGKVDLGDAFAMFLFHMLPFIFYTFLISAVLYSGFLFFRFLFIQRQT